MKEGASGRLCLQVSAPFTVSKSAGLTETISSHEAVTALAVYCDEMHILASNEPFGWDEIRRENRVMLAGTIALILCPDLSAA
jgi:hypothetical protein